MHLEVVSQKTKEYFLMEGFQRVTYSRNKYLQPGSART
jgi:hypothetical protein